MIYRDQCDVFRFTRIVRLFIAIELPESTKSVLPDVQLELKQSLPPRSVSWSRPETFHLTLRFLGSVNEEHLASLTESLAAEAAGHSPIELTCERLGCFPDLRYPRVLWAWVHGDGLAELQSAVSAACDPFAEKPADKRFTGHVTLGRFRQIHRQDADKIAPVIQGNANRAFGRWTADEVVLFRSEMRPDGVVHTALKHFPLRSVSIES